MLANVNTATHPDEVLSNRLKLKVLAFLKKRWNFYSAAQSVGVRRSLLYDWTDEKTQVFDPEFKRQLEEVRESHVDGCEENLMEQGVHNKKAYVPAIFMLKSWRPERYGDRMELDVKQNVTVDLSLSAKKTLEALGAAATGTQAMPSPATPAQEVPSTPAPQLPAHDETQEAGEQA